MCISTCRLHGDSEERGIFEPPVAVTIALTRRPACVRMTMVGGRLGAVGVTMPTGVAVGVAEGDHPDNVDKKAPKGYQQQTIGRNLRRTLQSETCFFEDSERRRCRYRAVIRDASPKRTRKTAGEAKHNESVRSKLTPAQSPQAAGRSQIR